MFKQIGLEKQSSVFLKVAVLHKFYCINHAPAEEKRKSQNDADFSTVANV